MFEQIRNSVFWQQKFDDAWRYNSMFLKLGDVDWRWTRRLEEKKSYWRDWGKRQNLSPSQAVYRAFEDIADTLFAEAKEKEKMANTWIELSNALHTAAIYADWNGPHKLAEERLAPRWQSYYAIYREKREAEDAEKERRANEVQSHRFDRRLIDEAWQNLLAGDVNRKVCAIWQHSEPPWKSAHQIATRANVPIRDFVFWMVVLRDHGFMTEHVVVNEHRYCNQRSWLEQLENLGEEERFLLRALAEHG